VALYEDNQPPKKAEKLADWILEAPRCAGTYFEGELPYKIKWIETDHDEPLYRIETRISPQGSEWVAHFDAAPVFPGRRSRPGC
jgi:hypothetical protein